MENIKLGIIGVTGMVGQTFLKILEDKELDVSEYKFFASARSAGKKIIFKGKEYTILELNDSIVKEELDIALVSAGGEISKEYGPKLASGGCIVIDNSSAFRMDKDVPLVVPEVNKEDVKKHNGIIANPNCSTIQAVVALKPLHDKYKIKRIIYTTFQAVSGSGMAGYRDLEEGLKGNPPTNYPHPIANNCLPHIDDFLDSGYTKEEMKMVDETRKMFHDDDLNITATCIRVPVFDCHSEAINVEFENEFDLDELRTLLENSNGIIVEDDFNNNQYPMAINAKGKDEVFVGRLRRDDSVPNGLNLWVVADNLRKGAATNAVNIAESVIELL